MIMQPTIELAKEHGPVKLMLRILEKMCERIEAGQNVPSDHLNEAMVFLREFADKCHHGKEEDYLFPAMKEKMGEDISAIDNLFDEHKNGRELVTSMTEAIAEANFTRFIESARKYSKLLDDHIVRENKDIFPEADRIISEEKMTEIQKGFENIEKNVIGEKRHQELEAIAHRLRDIYLSEKHFA